MNSAAPFTTPSFYDWQQGSSLRQRWPGLLAVVVLHLLLFYTLQQGLLQRAVHVVIPAVVYARMLPPPPAKLPPPPPAVAAPKDLTKNPLPYIPAPVIPQQVKENVQLAKTEEVPLQAPTPSQSSGTTPVQISAVSSNESSPAASAPRLITSGVQYLQAPQPQYPQASKRMGEQGKVMLKVLINEKGRAEHVDVAQSSGFQRLDQAARLAVLHAIFSPHLENGKAISVLAMVPIVFELDA